MTQDVSPPSKQRTEKRSKWSENQSPWPVLPGNKLYLVFSFVSSFMASRIVSFCDSSFLSKGFCWFHLCESNCEGFASPGIVKLVGELSIREEPTLGSCQCTIWSLIKQEQEELWQPERSLWVKGCEAGVWEELRLVWKGLVWMGSPRRLEELGGRRSHGWHRAAWLSGKGPCPGQGVGIRRSLRSHPTKTILWVHDSEHGVMGALWRAVGDGGKCGRGERWGCLPRIKDVAVPAEVERPKISKLNLRKSSISAELLFSFRFKEFLR